MPVNKYKVTYLFVAGLVLQGCVGVPAPTPRSDAEIAATRARVQALDDADYARTRARRQDLIDDVGQMQMNKAKAIREATKHTKAQSIIVTDY